MEVNEVKEMDCVEVAVEKKRYAKEGVHQGMQGWICHAKSVQGCWLVNFPQQGEKEDIATIPVKEEDMRIIDVMHASVNESIKARFDEADSPARDSDFYDNDLSEYLI